MRIVDIAEPKKIEASYNEALTCAGRLADWSGVLMLRGADVIDFVGRLSTNDLRNLRSDGAVTTVLTNEKGRVIDLVTLLHRGGSLLMITSGGNSERIRQWLERYVIMEDIQIDDVSHEYSIANVIGFQAGRAIEDALGIVPSANADRFVTGAGGGIEILVYRDALWAIPKYHILFKRNATDGDGVVPNIVEIPAEIVEILRVEQGVPKYAQEISESVNPVECGLQNQVSFTKGCYIGQEVIARIDSYKKLQKRLAGYIFDNTFIGALQKGSIYQNNREVGWTTSHCWSPALQKNIALGYISTKAPGESIEYRSHDRSIILPGRAVTLPFVVHIPR